MAKPVAIILAPDVESHDDPGRVIGRRTTYHGNEQPGLRGHEVVIVAVLKDSLRVEEYGYLKDDLAIQEAGGITRHDRIEVAPSLKKEGRLSFVTSDPRAVDLGCFPDLIEANGGAR